MDAYGGNGSQPRPHTSGQNHLQTFGDTAPNQQQNPDFQRLMSADTTKRFKIFTPIEERAESP